MSKRFDEWNEVKKTLHIKAESAHFRERETYVSTMGSNIGYEQDGKGEGKLRNFVTSETIRCKTA